MNPLSFPVAIGFLVVETVVILSDFPGRVTNHWTFVLFINLILLGTISRLSISKRRFPSASEIFDVSRNAVRFAVIMLYSFAVLHKLNSDFLNVDFSCAVDHYLKLHEKLPFLPVDLTGPFKEGFATEAIRTQIIAGTLLFEVGIPILLIFENTRFFGIIAAIFLHTVLGVNNFFDFSAVVFALVTFFIPADAPLFRKFDEIASRIPRTQKYFFISAICSMLLVIVASRYSSWLTRAFIFLGVLYGGVLCLLILKAIKDFRRSGSHEVLAFRPRLSAHYVILSLMVLNGSAPYLGLQTDNVFSMFSNLRTEGGTTNNLFVPASTQIFDYQRDLVEVIHDENGKLGRSKGGSVAYTHLDFTGLLKELAANTESFQPITYLYKSEIRTVSSLNEVDALYDSYSWIERKLLKFRAVRIGAVKKCDH